MDARDAFVALCCLSVFGFGYCMASVAAGYFGVHARAVQVQQRAEAAARLRVLQTGIPYVKTFTRFTLENPVIASFVRVLRNALDMRGIASSAEGVLSCLVCACLFLFTVCTLAGRAFLGLLAAVALPVLLRFRCVQVLESRREQMRNALPDVLQAMSSCFGAGFTLMQTFQHLEAEVAGPLGRLFGDAAKEMQTGLSSQTALTHLRERAGIDELSFVTVALAVQHQTGGSMSRVLDATRDSLKEEVEMKRSLRVHTAQAKLSARVVVGVTVGLVAAMMLLSRDFLTPFFSSLAGMAMLAVAIAMQVAGIVLIRSFLRVEVG